MNIAQEVFGISIFCITLMAILCDLLSEIFKDVNEKAAYLFTVLFVTFVGAAVSVTIGWVGCYINWHLIFTTV